MRELRIKDIRWISLKNPSEDDIKDLGEHFPQIHPLILEELRTPTIRPRVESYDHHIYMVLHSPKFIPGIEKSLSQEIDFILMNDTLITVQYDTIAPLEDFWHECEDKKIAGERYGKTPVHLLYYLLQKVFAVSLRELDQIQEEIDAIEEGVFSNSGKKTLEEITYLKRDLIDFRRSLKPQHLTLESLAAPATQLYGDGIKPFLADLVGEYLKVWNVLETHKETLDALYDTNRQLLATRTNEIMRVFTILAFITFIPTAIANIYGMNIQNIPLAGQENAFWAIMILMTVITAIVYLVLKWKKLV